MRTTSRIAILGLLALVAIRPVPLVAESYAVIVNKANPVNGGEESKDLVKQLYLKERTSWPGGAESKPVGPPKDSPAQRRFRERVLGMSDAEIAAHWLSLKQRTGQTPPRSVSSQSMALKLVAKYEGAFAVVSSEAAKGAEATVILEFGE